MTAEHDELLILCRNIRYLRESSGLSKSKLAKIIGVGVESISKIEQDVLPRRFGSKQLLNTCL